MFHINTNIIETSHCWGRRPQPNAKCQWIFISLYKAQTKNIAWFQWQKITSVLQRLSHTFFLTMSVSTYFLQRLSHNFFSYDHSHNVMLTISFAIYHFHNVFRTISFFQRCRNLFLYTCTYYFLRRPHNVLLLTSFIYKLIPQRCASSMYILSLWEVSEP